MGSRKLDIMMVIIAMVIGYFLNPGVIFTLSTGVGAIIGICIIYYSDKRKNRRE